MFFSKLLKLGKKKSGTTGSDTDDDQEDTTLRRQSTFKEKHDSTIPQYRRSMSLYDNSFDALRLDFEELALIRCHKDEKMSQNIPPTTKSSIYVSTKPKEARVINGIRFDDQASAFSSSGSISPNKRQLYGIESSKNVSESTIFSDVNPNSNNAASPSTQGGSKKFLFKLSPKRSKKPEYIVVKEVKKSLLGIGEVQTIRFDIRVHFTLRCHQMPVIDLLGWYEDDDVICGIYGYASKGDLLDVLNDTENPFEVSRFKLVHAQLFEICKIVQYMHNYGWAHKDLTLENILVDGRNRFHLHDFEFVEQIDLNSPYNSQDKYQTVLWAGKIEHMSPENYQTFAKVIKVFDPFASDVWSLGVIMVCSFSTTSFIWEKPDPQDKHYKKAMNDLESVLGKSFDLKSQKNKHVEKQLTLLTDLLTKIFVSEDIRITMDEIVGHEFFDCVRNADKKSKKSKSTTFSISMSRKQST